MTEVWLLRHATPLVPLGTCYGVTDMPADDAHTAASAEAFWRDWDAENEGLPDHLLCSPLRRCVQLGEELQRLRPQVVLRLHPDLREMNFGHWEGILWSEIPKSDIDEWTESFSTHRFGGAECVNDMVHRIGQLWTAQLAQTSESGKVPAVWVTHSGVIKAADWWVRSGGQLFDRADQWPTDPCPFGQWRKLSSV